MWLISIYHFVYDNKTLNMSSTIQNYGFHDDFYFHLICFYPWIIG